MFEERKEEISNFAGEELGQRDVTKMEIVQSEIPPSGNCSQVGV
jgi:hypothetical protein